MALINGFDKEDTVKRVMEIINLPNVVSNNKALVDCIETIKRAKERMELALLEEKLMDKNITKEQRFEILTKISQMQMNLK